MNSTEEVTLCQGSKYKLEVRDKYYELHRVKKGSYLLMYRFERSSGTGLAATCDRETVVEMCKELYEGPQIIPIRDEYVRISLQTHDSVLAFYFTGGSYTFRKFTRGRVKNPVTVDHTQFFQMVNDMCNLEFEDVELVKNPDKPGCGTTILTGSQSKALNFSGRIVNLT